MIAVAVRAVAQRSAQRLDFIGVADLFRKREKCSLSTEVEGKETYCCLYYKVNEKAPLCDASSLREC